MINKTKLTAHLLTTCLCISFCPMRGNILTLPIADHIVRSTKIIECGEELVDLAEIQHPRIRHMSEFDEKYKPNYKGCGKIRQGVYKCLLGMLENLPPEIGIAYFEGFRPLTQQEIYFTKKMREELPNFDGNSEAAYEETSKSVAPFIDNVPPHTTGAAIDMTLFKDDQLIDMGKFDTIFGPNDQQETFSPNISGTQKENRMLLLKSASEAGLVNYAYEWWHYSYGDQAYGYVKSKDAIYGAVVSTLTEMTKEEYLRTLISTIQEA